MTHVEQVARSIAGSINDYKVIINKSTVPIGSTKMVQRIIEESMEEHCEYDVVSNPEFLREGNAVSDFLNPSRIVIGSDSQKAVILLTELYRGLDAPCSLQIP